MKKIFAIGLAAFFAVFLLAGARPAEAAGKVRFQVFAVELSAGEAVVSGEFLNETGRNVELHSATIGLKATDTGGDALFDGEADFSGIGLFVAANDTAEYTFVLESGELQAYSDRFQWRVQSHLEWQFV